MTTRVAAAAWALLGAMVLCGCSARTHFANQPDEDRILVLVPDGLSFADPGVTVWLDAGSEEGLHLVPLHDSEFVRPILGNNRCAGVILPDSIHREASDAFEDKIRQYVSDGGKLMLVYDAGSLNLQGRYAGRRSRFSDLAGVDYALYDSLKDHTIQWEQVSGSPATMDQLGIPPGKYFPFSAAADPAGQAWDTATPATVRRYKFGDVEYPSLVTSGEYAGTVLLRSRAGVAAGYRTFGHGSVLFVNLPLGYLKGRTDGLFLHSFLKYFAGRLLHLPYLAGVPDGLGGLVLNWHMDSNAALQPLGEIATWKIFDQGPYSVHLTAGPDAITPGDGRGLDVPHNVTIQQLIHKLMDQGDAIGSHGGWIHNYFAERVEKGDPEQLKLFLEMNKKALEQQTGSRIVEYSAPDGNQPQWVTEWLARQGFLAYYFTGNTGMGPTQGYRDGKRAGWGIWAFPILHLDRAAAFEEMKSEGYGESQVTDWLLASTDFAASHRVARLIYFHPLGILAYQRSVQEWLSRTEELSREGRFRWYTMTQLASFLNQRQQVTWRLDEKDGTASLRATHPQNLEHQTWIFPQDKFAEPKVVSGSASVVRGDREWVVVAGTGKEIQVQARMLP